MRWDEVGKLCTGTYSIDTPCTPGDGSASAGAGGAVLLVMVLVMVR